MRLAGLEDMSYGKLPEEVLISFDVWFEWRGTYCGFYQPTLDEASVKLFRVVLFPDEGLPTNPIKGSRGMFLSHLLLRLVITV